MGALIDRSASIPTIVRTLSAHQKSMVGAPAYSRFVNRPVGRVFASAAFKAGLTPNQVTCLSGLCSLVGIVVIATVPIHWWLGGVVALLLMVGYALDSADGQLARLTGSGSPAGEWLDHVVDCVKIASLHLSVLIGLYRFTDLDPVLLLIPMAFVVTANLYFFSFILRDSLTRIHAVPADGSARKPSALRALMVAPTDYGLLCLVFLLWGVPTVFLAVYTLMWLGTAGYIALGMPKWFRDMHALKDARR